RVLATGGGRPARGAAGRVRARVDRGGARCRGRERGRGGAAARDGPRKPLPSDATSGDRSMTKWLCPLLVPLLVLGWAATPASAQTPPPGEIPPEQIEELLAFFNRVETIRMTGDS